jgi:hypothetical protein
MYKLKDWIDKDFLLHNHSEISKNPNAIYLLEKNQDKIDWKLLAMNPNPCAIHLLVKNPRGYNLNILSKIPKALPKKKKWKIFSLKNPVLDCEEIICDFTNSIKYKKIEKHERYFITELYPTFYYNHYLSQNPNAIHLLKKTPRLICWYNLSKNPNAIPLLEQNQDKIHWDNLSLNPNAIPLLEQNQDKIHWGNLSLNPNAIPLLEANPDKLYLAIPGEYSVDSEFSVVINLYELNCWRMIWYNLSKNPNAIHLLEANIDKINWDYLSENPNAIHLLEANQDKINWKHWDIQDKINWKHWKNLSSNPSIFELDYDALKKRCAIYKEELMQVALHPSRIQKILDYDISFDELDNYI